MTAFDYPVIDGAEAPVRHLIRGKDLGTNGSTQIIGHVISSDELGEIADTAATDHTVSATAIAIMKAILRDIGNVSGGGSSFTEGVVSAETINQAETVLATIDCRGKSALGIRINNTGGNALASFNVDTRFNSSSSYERDANYAGAYAGDSAAINGNSTLLIQKAGTNNPFTLANGSSTWIKLNVKAIESIQFVATGDGGATTVDAEWIAE